MKLVKEGIEYDLTDKMQIDIFKAAGYQEVVETTEETKQEPAEEKGKSSQGKKGAVKEVVETTEEEII